MCSSRFQLLLLRHISKTIHLRCGGIFSDSIITIIKIFLLILTLTKVWRSANRPICWRRTKSVPVFLGHPVACNFRLTLNQRNLWFAVVSTECRKSKLIDVKVNCHPTSELSSNLIKNRQSLSIKFQFKRKQYNIISWHWIFYVWINFIRHQLLCLKLQYGWQQCIR